MFFTSCIRLNGSNHLVPSKLTARASYFVTRTTGKEGEASSNITMVVKCDISDISDYLSFGRFFFIRFSFNEQPLLFKLPSSPEVYATLYSPFLSPLFYNSLFLPPATKLGQGYVFTGVCHSVNRGACVVAGGLCGCWGACMVAGEHAW